jgi:hypothetical protein
MIKVLYVDQTSGLVEDWVLDDLIAKGKIAAFCSSRGWIAVRGKRVSEITAEQKDSKERGRIHESAGNEGNCQAKGFKSREDEKR